MPTLWRVWPTSSIYPTEFSTKLRDQGRAAYQSFYPAVVLDQVMHQSGQDPQQVMFRDILLQLRDAKVTKPDWECLMNRTPTNVHDLNLPSTSFQQLKMLLSTM